MCTDANELYDAMLTRHVKSDVRKWNGCPQGLFVCVETSKPSCCAVACPRIRATLESNTLHGDPFHWLICGLNCGIGLPRNINFTTTPNFQARGSDPWPVSPRAFCRRHQSVCVCTATGVTKVGVKFNVGTLMSQCSISPPDHFPKVELLLQHCRQGELNFAITQQW